jgi:hypothetical protein
MFGVYKILGLGDAQQLNDGIILSLFLVAVKKNKEM